MSRATDEICRLIDGLTEADQWVVHSYLRSKLPLHALEQRWGTSAETILTAIDRSSDLTLRGVRGILAEQTFEEFILPPLEVLGWKSKAIARDERYDFLLESAGKSVRIQVKLQRQERGKPKECSVRNRAALNCPPTILHVVEVQKTRNGQRNGEKTRPYRFGDFDILAVNLHPSTGDWRRFMYTVGAWLLPDPQHPELIKTFQPVPAYRDDFWTDSLAGCIDWLLAGGQKRIYS